MRKSERFFKDSGKELNYIFCEPENIDTSKPVDLVYALHGLGGDAAAFSESTQICPESASSNSLVIIPSAINRVWQDESIDLLKKLNEKINTDYNIDKTHIVGHSMGGATALELFCDNGFSTDNIFAVSASYDYEGCNPEHGSNIYLYHYRGDAIVPVEGGASALPAVGNVVSQNELTNNAAIYNGCDMSNRQVIDEGSKTTAQYNNCNDNTIVRHTEDLPSNLRPHSWQKGQTGKILDIIESRSYPSISPSSFTSDTFSKPSFTAQPSFPEASSSASSNRPDIGVIASIAAGTAAALVFGSMFTSFFCKKTNLHTERLERERDHKRSGSNAEYKIL
ncbi:MAG: hypothetical protein COV35_04845 [Alphaproteobacteria bacterium CG11_big_fil_rev_8_21_14_0_20_39_49]|nr:MAG: hypothetical protein COV35_04845 [Alphaproteobacteria bacterium CG11_big_fil_rev_8_21_14_0_20_39_49]